MPRNGPRKCDIITARSLTLPFLLLCKRAGRGRPTDREDLRALGASYYAYQKSNADGGDIGRAPIRAFADNLWTP
eukprot:160376-Pyramimonas_sp.AAC.1